MDLKVKSFYKCWVQLKFTFFSSPDIFCPILKSLHSLWLPTNITLPALFIYTIWGVEDYNQILNRSLRGQIYLSCFIHFAKYSSYVISTLSTLRRYFQFPVWFMTGGEDIYLIRYNLATFWRRGDHWSNTAPLVVAVTAPSSIDQT